MRRALLVAALLVARTAAADTLIPLRKGREIVADMSGSIGYLLSFVPRVEEPRRSLETLLQVAPGGALVAVFKPYTRELVVMDGAGAVALRVPRCSGAFRFAPDGSRLAVVTGGHLVIEPPRGGARQDLGRVGAVSVVRWIDADGLVIADLRGGSVRLWRGGAWDKPVKLRGLQAIAAGGGKVVAFQPRTLRIVGGATLPIDDDTPVSLAEVSPDGRRVVFATSRRAYLSEDNAPPRVIAESPGIHSLAFALDGASIAWASRTAGVVGDVPVPAGAVALRYRQDAPGVVLTTDNVFTWEPGRGAPTLVGGVSAEEGIDLAGEIVAGKPLTLFQPRPKR